MLKSRTLSLKALRKLAKKIKIPNYSKQSKVMIENLILDLFTMLVGGQGNCHQYTHSVGESGGWTGRTCHQIIFKDVCHLFFKCHFTVDRQLLVLNECTVHISKNAQLVHFFESAIISVLLPHFCSNIKFSSVKMLVCFLRKIRHQFLL